MNESIINKIKRTQELRESNMPVIPREADKSYGPITKASNIFSSRIYLRLSTPNCTLSYQLRRWIDLLKIRIKITIAIGMTKETPRHPVGGRFEKL